MVWLKTNLFLQRFFLRLAKIHCRQPKEQCCCKKTPFQCCRTLYRVIYWLFLFQWTVQYSQRAVEYSQQGKGPFHLQEELPKFTENYFAFVYMPWNLWILTPTNFYFATSICYICYFHLNNYGGEPLLSLIFHKTVTKIRLCYKYELFLTQNKENITASQWRKNYHNTR